MEFTTLQPAYGRDYKSRRALLEDWIAGKDFQCTWSSRYCSSRDFQQDKVIRYKGNKSVTVLKYTKATGTWR